MAKTQQINLFADAFLTKNLVRLAAPARTLDLAVGVRFLARDRDPATPRYGPPLKPLRGLNRTVAGRQGLQ